MIIRLERTSRDPLVDTSDNPPGLAHRIGAFEFDTLTNTPRWIDWDGHTIPFVNANDVQFDDGEHFLRFARQFSDSWRVVQDPDLEMDEGL